ncbi:MAG: plasmid stabilization protein [Spirochaetes bacterium RBG_16_49_21]|nr:MAG: plasmid stabilization protein [Spirochaetes bacterium RBG_16_49_21]
MAEIRWTLEAAKWLQDIHDYIAQENPNASQNVISDIHEKAQILRNFPQIGYLYRSEPEGDIRILLYGHYRITYLIKNQDTVEILGVFHGALDIDKYFP